MAKLRMLILTAVVALLALAASGCGGYTDRFGNSYDDDQVSQYCHGLRPGSAAYERHDCGFYVEPTR